MQSQGPKLLLHAAKRAGSAKSGCVTEGVQWSAKPDSLSC